MQKLMTLAAAAALAACAAHAGAIDWEALGATYADGTPIKNTDCLQPDPASARGWNDFRNPNNERNTTMSTNPDSRALPRVNLSSPWETYARKLEALFEGDDEVTVTPDFRADERKIRVCVANAAKADALARLLPASVDFGNVTVAVTVVPGNEAWSPVVLIRTAFRGNPNFEDALEIKPEGCSNPVVYAEFAPEVAQYWNDDLSSPHGLSSALYADLAADTLMGEKARGVIFTTTLKD